MVGGDGRCVRRTFGSELSAVNSQQSTRCSDLAEDADHGILGNALKATGRIGPNRTDPVSYHVGSRFTTAGKRQLSRYSSLAESPSALCRGAFGTGATGTHVPIEGVGLCVFNM